MWRVTLGRLHWVVLLCAAGILTNCPAVLLRSNADQAAANPNPSKVASADKRLSAVDQSIAIGVATHRQVKTLQVNAAGHPQARVSSFCLTPDDKILAGCVASTGEIRVLDSDGNLLDTWELPVKPEAVFARPDGAIFVAGDGQILKLSSTGKVELSKEAPQAKALKEEPQKLRAEVIEAAKQQAEQFSRQTEMYDKMIERANKEIDSINKQLAELNKGSHTPQGSEAPAAEKQAVNPNGAHPNNLVLSRRLEMYQAQKEQFARAKAQWAQLMGGNVTDKLTDKQIDERVKSSLAYKMKASSISALDEDVFLATHAALGYGFEVWRMNDRLENPVKIVKDLSGCCGQMDVKVSKDGVFVAENSQHRVCRFDRDGKAISKWGYSARTGLEGFGSCCNPMNVAFGPGGAVYTAEDDTGRIKRYTIDGKLLGLVGVVDLKPGCKNCSIAVSSNGNQVYMLDITRNFIVRLDARPKNEIAAEIEKVKNAPAVKPTDSSTGTSASNSAGGDNTVVRVLRALFSD